MSTTTTTTAAAAGGRPPPRQPLQPGVKRWIVGIDPGRTNGGACFFDRFEFSARLMLIDFMQRPNPKKRGRVEKTVYDEKHVFMRVHEFVDAFDAVFREAHLVLVEKQMEREHCLFATAMISYVRGRYGPLGVRCVSASQVSIRASFRFQGPDYDARKELSIEAAAPFLGPSVAALCAVRFWKNDATNKRGVHHADPHDGLMLCMYGHYFEAKALALDAAGPRFHPRQKAAGEPPMRAVYTARLYMEAGEAEMAARVAAYDAPGAEEARVEARRAKRAKRAGAVGAAAAGGRRAAVGGRGRAARGRRRAPPPASAAAAAPLSPLSPADIEATVAAVLAAVRARSGTL